MFGKITQEGPFKERSPPEPSPKPLCKRSPSHPTFVGMDGDFLRKGFEGGPGGELFLKKFPLGNPLLNYNTKGV